MNEVINLENIVQQKVQQLCAKNPDYETMLREIVAADKCCESPGWQYKDVPSVQGGHIASLMNIGIINQTYKSSNYTHYKLAVPCDEIEATLDDIELGRLEQEKRKMETERQRTKGDIINPELITKFEKMLTDGTDMLEYWGKWINPKIEGLDHVKKAILLSIASHGDKFGDRGRLHVLMFGDPGSAKSALKDWVVYQLGAESCSQRTSKVGLTGCASGEEITPGALARAHNKVLCIDELDKFSNEDRQALLESMEEGVVLIEAGGMTARFDAECRVIGCANVIEKFSPELLDRFDFRIEMRTPSAETEKRIVCTVLDHWFESKEGYDGRDLGAYIQWIKSFEPVFPRDVREKAKLLIQMLIDLEESIRGSMRKKESVLRVAFTIAKLHKRNVEVKDFISAIKLLFPAMNGGKIQALEQLAGK